MTGYMGNFPNVWELGKFSKIPRYLRNFPHSQEFGEFPKFLGISSIYEISRNLGILSNGWIFEKFPLIEK